MNNIIKYQDNGRLLQTLEKARDSLVLRKNLAVQYGLTSITDFNEGWAITYRDNKRGIMNEDGKRLVDTDDDTPIETDQFIFPVHNGLVIVIDEWKYGYGTRIYTTEGKRIKLPIGRDIDWFANRSSDERGEHFIKDESPYSVLRNYYNGGGNTSFGSNSDYRKRLIFDDMIPLHIDAYKNDERIVREIKKVFQMRGGLDYALMDKNNNFLKTDLGHYFVCSKNGINRNTGWMPTINPELEYITEDMEGKKISQSVFYMVDKTGKSFRDEFGQVVFSDDPYRINHFDSNNQSIVQVEPQAWLPNNEKIVGNKAYLCSINKNGTYLKNEDGSIKKIPFDKYHYSHSLGQKDVHGYEIDLFHNITTHQRTTEGAKINQKYYNFSCEEISTPCYGLLDYKSHFGYTINLGKGILAYSQHMYYDYHYGEMGGKWHFINTLFKNRPIKFPDGTEFIAEYDYTLIGFNDKYIYVNNREGKENIVSINGLIVRYCMDEEGRELKDVDIRAIEDKFIVVEFNNNEGYYILDKNFRYLKNNKGEKILFKKPPSWHNGVFNEYDISEQEQYRFIIRDNETRFIKRAYFEDGTIVGDTSQVTKIENKSAQQIAGILTDK